MMDNIGSNNQGAGGGVSLLHFPSPPTQEDRLNIDFNQGQEIRFANRG